MKIAYLRVSTFSQSLARQEIEVKEYENTYGVKIDKVVTEKKPGKNFADRPAYNEMKSWLELNPGSELIVTSIDRLGRNYDELEDEIKDLKDKKIKLRVLDFKPSLEDNEDNEIAKLLNDMMMKVMIYMASTERKKIRERQRKGIDNWIDTGKTKTNNPYGRPRLEVDYDEFERIYQKWKATPKEYTARQAMKDLNLKPNTFYRMVHDREGKIRDNHYEENRKRPLQLKEQQ